MIALYSHIKTKTSPDDPLLLAHYTSVEVAEKILRDEEVWFGNPLYMNDLGEMRTGIALGNQLFPEAARQAEDNSDRVNRLIEGFNFYIAHLSTTESILDTYVFCLCEHKHPDGLLSMWREYGRKGNGAALVFNTQKVHYQAHSPLIIAKVNYASDQERQQQLRQSLTDWARITRAANLSEDKLHLAAYRAFNLVKSISLTTKHHGFSEEEEWRIIYVPERDPLGYLKSQLGYFVGPHGVEPKLKYKLGGTLHPGGGVGVGADLTTGTLSDVLEFVILGPTISSPLARLSFIRMLQQIKKEHFSDRVLPSTIPLRPSDAR
jgi:hypothetical protein